MIFLLRKEMVVGATHRFLALQSIEGRLADSFLMPTGYGGELVHILPGDIEQAIVSGYPQVGEYRVVQSGAQRIRVELAGEPDNVRPVITQSLLRLFESLPAARPTIDFQVYARPHVRHVKMCKVYREWQPDVHTPSPQASDGLQGSRTPSTW